MAKLIERCEIAIAFWLPMWIMKWSVARASALALQAQPQLALQAQPQKTMGDAESIRFARRGWRTRQFTLKSLNLE